MQPGNAYIINGTTSSATPLLNQGTNGSLASISLSDGTPPAVQANQWTVPFQTGADVSGVLSAGGSTLQLIGPQYSSTGSPEFRIEVDTMVIPPANSWIFVWFFRQSLSITDQNGNTAGIKVTPLNDPAKKFMTVSPQ